MSQRKSSIHNYHDINTQLFTHSPLTYQSEVWSSQFTQNQNAHGNNCTLR